MLGTSVGVGMGRTVWVGGWGGGRCGWRRVDRRGRNQLPFTLADGKIARALSMGHERRWGGEAGEGKRSRD